LVVDDGDLVALCAEPQHRAHEVRARPAEQPRAAHDPRPLTGGGLAQQLRPAVYRTRGRRIRLEIRRTLLSGEDVVGREVDERRAELGGMLRAADVRRGGALWIV